MHAEGPTHRTLKGRWELVPFSQNNKARRMGKQSRSKAGKPSNAAQPEPPTACGGGSSSGGIVSSTRLFTKGDLLKRDQASLVLVRRSTGQSEWAFAERAANVPPLATMREPMKTIEAAARLSGADPERFWWWITDEALDGMAAELSANSFCVLDGLLGRTFAGALRDEVAGVRAAGRLQLSKLAGGRNGSMLTYTHTAVRGDLVGWFDGEEAGLWPHGTLVKYLQKVDTLIAQLGERVPLLAHIASRSKAMIACYPGAGARYIRHCDNSCDSGRGERCNGRRLTAIIYLNEGWAPLDGGELRVFAPYAPKGQPAVADVQPLFDRLLLFFADYRVPHEVLAAHADRLAITLWYFDKAEYTRARERGEAADFTDQSEAKTIEEEIAKFEARYGAGAMRHSESKVNTPC